MRSWFINAYDSEMCVNLYIGFIGCILARKNSTGYSNLFLSRDFKNDKIVKAGLWVRHYKTPGNDTVFWYFQGV